MLRNAQAVAQRYGSHIAVIPAGERWSSAGSLRPAFEDLVVAGAVISYLPGTRSPEAHAAATTFQGVQSDLAALLQSCGSGKELMARGFAKDVALEATLNVSACVPVFNDGAYVLWETTCSGALPVPVAPNAGHQVRAEVLRVEHVSANAGAHYGGAGG